MPTLKTRYIEEVAPALMKKFEYKSVMQIPKIDKVVVEGINMVSCHIKPRKQGEEGGIVKREAALYASKVQVVCPKCGKGTRVAHKIENGKKTRVCKHCGAEL